MGLINPPKKKKRRTDFNNADEPVQNAIVKSTKTRAEYEYENNILDKYKTFKDAIKSKPKRSKFVELKNFLADQKDNEEILQEIAKNTDYEFIAKLLTTYTGTQALSDLVVFDILKFYERTVKFNFKPLLPLVCGPNTESHYANLVKLGRAVHICPKPDEVLQGLNSEILWETGVYSSLFSPDDPEQKNPLHYDPRYISMLLLGMVEGGADLTLRLFVEKNALSFAAFLLSHPRDNLRIYGYAILSDFLLKIQDISSETFYEKPLFVYTLIYLKDNLKKPNLKIGNASAHFFAKVFKLFLQPENPVYNKIVTFLTVKPDFKLNDVPEFLRMLLSTSTETFKDERIWALELAATSMLSSNDYKIFDKTGGPSLCLSMLASPFGDKMTMTYIFYLLQKMVSISTGAMELCHRHNFHTWVITTMQYQNLTRWEIGFLTQIFVKYVETVNSSMKKSNEHRAQYHIKETDQSRQQKFIKSCARKVAEVVGKVDDEVKEKWFTIVEGIGTLENKKVEQEEAMEEE